MPAFSLSLKKPGRVGEPKLTFNKGELGPTSGEAVELRVDEDAYKSKLEFWGDLFRLLQRMRELDEPRPEFVSISFALIRITEDGEIRNTEDDVSRQVEAA